MTYRADKFSAESSKKQKVFKHHLVASCQVLEMNVAKTDLMVVFHPPLNKEPPCKTKKRC